MITYLTETPNWFVKIPFSKTEFDGKSLRWGLPQSHPVVSENTEWAIRCEKSTGDGRIAIRLIFSGFSPMSFSGTNKRHQMTIHEGPYLAQAALKLLKKEDSRKSSADFCVMISPK